MNVGDSVCARGRDVVGTESEPETCREYRKLGKSYSRPGGLLFSCLVSSSTEYVLPSGDTAPYRASRGQAGSRRRPSPSCRDTGRSPRRTHTPAARIRLQTTQLPSFPRSCTRLTSNNTHIIDKRGPAAPPVVVIGSSLPAHSQSRPKWSRQSAGPDTRTSTLVTSTNAQQQPPPTHTGPLPNLPSPAHANIPLYQTPTCTP